MTGPDGLSAALSGRRVLVAGTGVTGSSAVDALTALGAEVTTADRSDGSDDSLPAGTELVVVSPGWAPTHPLLIGAAAAGVPVWGDVELAFRLRPPGQRWLGVTGTNGKTTTVQMLAAILAGAGVRSVAAGNVGYPLLDAVLADPPYDVLAVEVSSFQLHWTSTVEFAAATILNLAPDHLDWHGTMAAYVAAKALVWRGSALAVVNLDDPLVVRLAEARGRTLGVTLRPPAEGQTGVRDGTILERTRGGEDVVLAAVGDVRPPAPHNVADALAAAALARTVGVPPAAVSTGLRGFSPGAHRIEHVASIGGVDYVDDSKATNPHAAAASLQAFDRVVWVAGGLAKGARFDEVVQAVAGRLRAAVLLGRDRALLAQALGRHAPEIPVVEVGGTDTGAMDDAVRAAAGLAEPGDTVLLAPACASMDMFRDYGARGDAFASAVRRLEQ